MKADFHGAIITGNFSFSFVLFCFYPPFFSFPFLFEFTDLDNIVEKSKCPTLIGMTGILIQETQNTMKIVTKEDELKGTFYLFIYLFI